MSEARECKLCGEHAEGRIEMRKHIMHDHSSTERFDALHTRTVVEHTDE